MDSVLIRTPNQTMGPLSIEDGVAYCCGANVDVQTEVRIGESEWGNVLRFLCVALKMRLSNSPRVSAAMAGVQFWVRHGMDERGPIGSEELIELSSTPNVPTDILVKTSIEPLGWMTLLEFLKITTKSAYEERAETAAMEHPQHSGNGNKLARVFTWPVNRFGPRAQTILITSAFVGAVLVCGGLLMWRHHRGERTKAEGVLHAASAGFDRVRVQRFVDTPPSITQEAFNSVVKGLTEHSSRAESERKRATALMDSSITFTLLGILCLIPFLFMAFFKLVYSLPGQIGRGSEESGTRSHRPT